MVNKPNIDLKALLKTQLQGAPWVNELSEHLNGYEKKIKSVVKDLDLRSRDARDKSRKQLDGFARQLTKTRDDLEKRIRGLVNTEAKRLNEGFNELVTYLRALSHKEAATVTPTPAKTKSTKKRSSGSPVKKVSSAKKASPRAEGSAAKKVSRKGVTTKSNSSSEVNSSLPV